MPVLTIPPSFEPASRYRIKLKRVVQPEETSANKLMRPMYDYVVAGSIATVIRDALLSAELVD